MGCQAQLDFSLYFFGNWERVRAERATPAAELMRVLCACLILPEGNSFLFISRRRRSSGEAIAEGRSPCEGVSPNSSAAAVFSVFCIFSKKHTTAEFIFLLFFNFFACV